MKCASQFPNFYFYSIEFSMITLFNNLYFVGLNITKPPWCHPHSSRAFKQYQEKGKGHCCLGDLHMRKQDIELQNFLNTRIVQWMKPQSLWHNCVVNHVAITCVTCFTWICVTIDGCWCDSCVDSCHLWCVLQSRGLSWMSHNYI